MTISFSCDCGAVFEVSEDMAGFQGRCRKCGREMTIPHRSVDAVPQPPDEPLPLPEEKEAPRPVSPSEARFCPFCGKPTPTAATMCPSCFKPLRPRPPRLIDGSQLTLSDWILVTVFAPVGVLGGLLHLILGRKKGLNMIALATACMVIWWFAFAIIGWIR